MKLLLNYILVFVLFTILLPFIAIKIIYNLLTKPHGENKMAIERHKEQKEHDFFNDKN